MKMKEQNAYLSLVGFLQLVIVGTAGTFINELLKEHKSIGLMGISIVLGSLALVCGTDIYMKVFKAKKRKD